MSSQHSLYPGAVTSMIRYGDQVQGFLAVPENQPGPFGAVVLGHERYGLAQHTLDLVAKFAAHGYVALAPDMLSRWDGDKDAVGHGDIQVRTSDQDIRSYMGDSLDYLLAHHQVDPDRIFGAGDVLLADDLTGRGHTTAVYGDNVRVSVAIPLSE